METASRGVKDNIPVKPTTYESRHAMDGKFTFIDQRCVQNSNNIYIYILSFFAGVIFCFLSKTNT